MTRRHQPVYVGMFACCCLFELQPTVCMACRTGRQADKASSTQHQRQNGRGHRQNKPATGQQHLCRLICAADRVVTLPAHTTTLPRHCTRGPRQVFLPCDRLVLQISGSRRRCAGCYCVGARSKCLGWCSTRYPPIDKLPSPSELRSRPVPATRPQQSRSLLLSFRGPLDCTTIDPQPFDISRLANHPFLSIHRLRQPYSAIRLHTW